MHKEIPPFAQHLLDSCPASGEGVHNWLFRAARVLHRYRSESQIEALLQAASQGCGRNIPAQEMHDAVRNSKRYMLATSGKETKAKSGSVGSKFTANPRSRWPKRNPKAAALSKDSFDVAALRESSPFRFDGDPPRTEEIIDLLFPGDPWLCVGASIKRFGTKRRGEWRGQLQEKQLIVPSPMTARTGTTKDGRISEHTLDNTGARRFLVIEFDEGPFDTHAAIIGHLSEYAPLVLALHSGGKSLHGWFWAKNSSEAIQYRFMRYAVSLGADPATWTRSQFVRIPDGLRENGSRQYVIYFNPAKIKQ